MIITFTKKGAFWYHSRVKTDVTLLSENGERKVFKDLEEIDLSKVPVKYNRVNFDKPSNTFIKSDEGILRITNVVGYNMGEKQFKKICLKCGKVKSFNEFAQRGRLIDMVSGREVRQDYPYCTDCRANYKGGDSNKELFCGYK